MRRRCRPEDTCAHHYAFGDWLIREERGVDVEGKVYHLGAGPWICRSKRRAWIKKRDDTGTYFVVAMVRGGWGVRMVEWVYESQNGGMG